jgi:hypothetical protein
MKEPFRVTPEAIQEAEIRLSLELGVRRDDLYEQTGVDKGRIACVLERIETRLPRMVVRAGSDPDLKGGENGR